MAEMSYYDYLKGLLYPLGVYDLEDGSYNAAELKVIGAALDEACGEAEALEREMFIQTAENYGLYSYGELFPVKIGSGVSGMRAALMALMRINDHSSSEINLDSVLSGCGTAVHAEKGQGAYQAVISFPDVQGVPAKLSEIKKWIERFMPCHLEFVYACEQV